MNRADFFNKEWLLEVNRVHPPKEEQIVDDKLRLHRAERLYKFPEKFFSDFVSIIKQEDVRYYPYIHEFKKKLADTNGLNEDNIFLNNGSSENIRVFYDAFAIRNREVLITEYCYPMHKVYALLNGSRVKEIKYKRDLVIDYDSLIDNIDENKCCIVLANPNSPIGDILGLNQIEEILKKSSKYNIPILIDEAYIEYSEQESCIKFLEKYDNLVISRTFSKAYGCAGLRIGYLLANKGIMNVINKFIPTYEISSISAKFGLHLLNHQKVISDYLNLIKQEREKIKIICGEHEIKYIINHINTIYLKPKNIGNIISRLNNERLFYRTRKLPYDDDDWLAIVLYPDFTDGNIMKIIRDENNMSLNN